MKTTTLMYHDVVEGDDFDCSGFQGAAADRYKLSRRNFEQHLDAIAARGAQPRLVSESDWTAERPLFLTFDDGGVSCFENVAPLLETHGWRGHFFIPTDCIGRQGFLETHHLRELAQRGHAIGSHSASHPTRMSSLSHAQLLEEWSSSRSRLEDILGAPVDVASLPGGYYSQAVGQAAAQAGIRVLFYSEPTVRVRKIGDCWLLGRYSLKRHMDARTAAAFAGGHWAPGFWQAVRWQCKKAPKTMVGGTYLKLSRSLLGEPPSGQKGKQPARRHP